MGKVNAPTLLLGMQTGAATMEVSLKTKIELPFDPAILLLGTYPKKPKNTHSKRYMHPNVHRQPKCPSTDDWFKKVWYIYTIDYYSVIKKNEILPFAATWMDLGMIIISKSEKRQISYAITYM